MKTYIYKRKKYKNFFKASRKITLLGLLFLLFLIPFTLHGINQQKNTKSSAAATATISFGNIPQSVNVGQEFTLDINMNPNGHNVSFVKLTINYDASKLAKGSTGIVNTSAFPIVLDGPTYQQCANTTCTMSVSLAVGSDPQKAIASSTKVATVTFLALSGGSTNISFGNDTQMLSVTATDTANENVLSTPTSQAAITITGSGTIDSPTPGGDTPVPTIPENPSGTLAPTPTGITTPASITLGLPGVGQDGGNSTPNHSSRNAIVTLIDTATGQSYTAIDAVTYDQQQTTDQLSIVAFFSNKNFNLGVIPSGTYTVYAKVDQYLQAKLTDAVDIIPGQLVTLPKAQLIIGDIAPIPGTNNEPFGDNVLDIQDYNVFISCFGVKAATRICPNRLGADLNDDGAVDGVDYNLLLIGLQTQLGLTNSGLNPLITASPTP